MMMNALMNGMIPKANNVPWLMLPPVTALNMPRSPSLDKPEITLASRPGSGTKQPKRYTTSNANVA